MKIFIILDMKRNKIDNFSLKISFNQYWPLKEYWPGRLKPPVKMGGGFNRPTLLLTNDPKIQRYRYDNNF